MKKFFGLIILSFVMLTACASPASKISIENAWGRPSPTVAQAGAFYLTIRNNTNVADKLTAAKSSACGTAEVHESYVLANGAMGMRMVMGGLDIPASGAVEFKVGGLHIMCIDKKVELTNGVKLPLTLVFDKAGEINTTVEIKDQ